MMLAAANGHATVSAMLGSVPEQSLDIKNNDGHNAIMLAGSGGHAEVVRALFETGRLEAATAVSWGGCIDHSNGLQLTWPHRLMRVGVLRYRIKCRHFMKRCWDDMQQLCMR